MTTTRRTTRTHRIYACVHVLNGTAEVWSLRDAELPRGLRVVTDLTGGTAPDVHQLAEGTRVRRLADGATGTVAWHRDEDGGVGVNLDAGVDVLGSRGAWAVLAPEVAGYWGLMRECYACTYDAMERPGHDAFVEAWDAAVTDRAAQLDGSTTAAEAELVQAVEDLLAPVHQPRERAVSCSGCGRDTLAVHGRCDRCGALDCDRCRVEL